MELTESISSLNHQLIDLYGIDTVTGQPMFRIVWANDQLEKRKVTHTPEGLELMHPIVMEVPKYTFAKDRFILERLVIIPEVNLDELPANKLSYEPIWVFESSDGRYLPPALWASQFVIDALYAALGKVSLAKYKEGELNTTKEGREHRIQEMQMELFGNETETGDALAHGEGVVVPNSYETTKKES